jgi:hypothetical protein
MKNKIVVLITVILSISIVVLISNNMKDNKEIKLTDMTENNISYSKEKINIYLFYGEGCPHCEELKNYLNSLDNKEKSYFNIYTFEVWNNSTNQQFMKESAKSLNKEVSGVPFLIIGNKTFEGYNESMNIKIKKATKTEYKLNGKNDYYKEYKSAK